MNRMTVLYDADHAACVEVRWWLARQPAYVELDFLPGASPLAGRRFPMVPGPRLTVVADDGAVYRGDDAYVMCLWALVEHRETALHLSAPARRRFARQVVESLAAAKGRTFTLTDTMLERMNEASPP